MIVVALTSYNFVQHYATISWPYNKFSAFLRMKSKADIIRLAELKVEASICLLENEHYDNAYYLAGYAIELCLKAHICKNLGLDGFFNFNYENVRKDLYKPFKNHDYTELILLSGLHSEFLAQMQNPVFKDNWTYIFKWSENCRYEYGLNPMEVIKFVNSSKEFCQWIEKRL